LLLTGSTIANIQRQYEVLSDIVSEYNGKVHGSQSHVIPTANNNNNNSMQLIVYHEIPQGQRDEVKSKFDNYISQITFQRN
jgi:bisphosphoglycerate-independent phosphoglycerate mutase (AlkP superfamily)